MPNHLPDRRFTRDDAQPGSADTGDHIVPSNGIEAVRDSATLIQELALVRLEINALWERLRGQDVQLLSKAEQLRRKDGEAEELEQWMVLVFAELDRRHELAPQETLSASTGSSVLSLSIENG